MACSEHGALSKGPTDYSPPLRVPHIFHLFLCNPQQHARSFSLIYYVCVKPCIPGSSFAPFGAMSTYDDMLTTFESLLGTVGTQELDVEALADPETARDQLDLAQRLLDQKDADLVRALELGHQLLQLNLAQCLVAGNDASIFRGAPEVLQKSSAMLFSDRYAPQESAPSTEVTGGSDEPLDLDSIESLHRATQTAWQRKGHASHLEVLVPTLHIPVLPLESAQIFSSPSWNYTFPTQVWCGVVWCGVVWCGVVWCGVVWCAKGAVTK